MLFTQYSIILLNMMYVQECNPYTDQYVELFQQKNRNYQFWVVKKV